MNWYQRRIWNPKATVIARSIRNEPEKWERDFPTSFCLCRSGLKIWLANGWWFCAIDKPQEEKLGLIGRTIVWIECKRWLRAHPVDPYAGNAAALESFKATR